MKNKKHKIFLYPLEENGKVRVFLFQSGDIGDKRSRNECFRYRHMHVNSISSPQLCESYLYTNGGHKDSDFLIETLDMQKEEFENLKELENAYNNREE